jgi:hypothetical protein
VPVHLWPPARTSPDQSPALRSLACPDGQG